MREVEMNDMIVALQWICVVLGDSERQSDNVPAA